MWSYSALRIGRHPTLGPDFEELKGIWKDLAGKPLRIRGTVGHAGADWEAFSDLFGTRRWNHGRCPCQWCSTSLQDMHDLTKQHGPLSREIMDAEKEATCVTVQLTRDLAQGLQTQLEYDTRKDGSKGRALLTTVGPTLRTGDRLEWIQGCQDLRIDITALPENITVKFFRPAPTSRLTSWCALYFCDDYGGGPLVEPGQLVGDILHTVDGGCAQYCGGAIFNLTIEHAECVLGAKASTNKVVRRLRALGQIRLQMRLWALSADSKGYTVMSYITIRNLIGADKACIDAKAIESRGLFVFVVWLLAKTVHKFRRLPGDVSNTAMGLLKSGQCLRQWYAHVYAHGPVIPGHICKDALAATKKHVSLFRMHSGQALKPKHHAFIDMTRAMPVTGNPTYLATFVDETVNVIIGRLTRSVHPATFPVQLLKKDLLGRMIFNRPFLNQKGMCLR